MEIRGRKQNQGKRFDKQSSTIKLIPVDRKIAFEARTGFTVEIQKPCVACNNSIKGEKKRETKLQTIYEHESS